MIIPNMVNRVDKSMATINNRRHERIKHRASIRVATNPEQVHVLDMRDFSESGMYLACTEKNVVTVGDEVEVQTLELEDAPILKSKVMRVDKDGFAVEFIM